MDKRLINTLLRIFHSPDTRFASGRAISAFCSEYNLGVRQGSSLVFNDAHKAEIGRILKGSDLWMDSDEISHRLARVVHAREARKTAARRPRKTAPAGGTGNAPD